LLIQACKEAYDGIVEQKDIGAANILDGSI